MESNQRRDNYTDTGKYILRKMVGTESRDSMREMDRKLRANKKLLQATTHLLDKRAVFNQTIQNMNDYRAKTYENNTTTGNNTDNFAHAMYNITSMQHKSNRRFIASCIPQSVSRNNQLLTTREVFQDTRKLMARFTVTASLMVAILFILCSTARGASTSSETVSSSSTLNQNSHQNSIERSISEKDHHAPASIAAASPSPSTLSSQSSASVVASLSSAVASAAAAAAVAAAKDTLSSNDARSLLSSSSSTGSNGIQNHVHQSRSPSLHLALKIADAIPEVPYSILHNMKKLDHAAPFYNVPNKVTSGGSVKESSHNLLSSALSASGGLGGAADHLSSLFKSPLWKRIADGYGEFTSEFRSIFNQWQPTTAAIGRPQKSATKLLRDISVPALLMLFASTFPTDWRPTKTRRKLLVPSDLSQSASAAISALDPMIATSPEQPNYSSSPQVFRPSFNMATYQPQNRGSFNSMNDLEQSGTTSSQFARINGNDVNFQPQSAQDAISTISWMSATSQPASMSQNHYESLPMQQQQQLQQQPQPQPQPLSIRRIGEFNAASTLTNNDLKYLQKDMKLVKSDRIYSSAPAATSSLSSTNQAVQNAATAGGLFSSITSSLANVKHSNLMNRIMNANGNENQQATNSYRMMSLGDVSDGQKFSSFLRPNRDHFNDRHRYSLVAPDDNELTHFNNLNEQQSEKLSTSSKPFFLSAMTHAITSMFDRPLAESGSLSPSLRSSNRDNIATVTKSSPESGEQQHYIISDKTLSRRQQQVGNGEQRDLSLLLPQSWKEVVKRTVNNVKQEASTQWRSIEGQLTNWVQDKLKTLPIPSASPSSGSSTSSSSAVSAPVANIIATVSSTAMNILGLSNKSPSSSSPSSITHSATTSSSNSNDSAQTNSSQSSASSNDLSSGSGSSSGTSNGVQRGGKNDGSPNKNSGSGKGGGALAGVANMIVNTLTSRTSAPSSSHSSSTQSHSKIADDFGSVISQYPTLTGAQPSQASVSSMASGTASTVAAISTMMNN